MKFHCPGCRIVFSVPDDKIPEGKELKILCPKCRTPVDRRDEPLAPDDETADQKRMGSASVAEEDESDDASSLEVLDEGVKAALLYLSSGSRQESLTQVLRQLDYYVSVAGTAKSAINRLHQNRYDVVMVDEKIGGHKESDNLVLHHIQLLPMHLRRQFFLCLMSENLPTLDKTIAFRLGVDMILNVGELDNAKIILVKALKEHKTFYRAFNKELEKKG